MENTNAHSVLCLGRSHVGHVRTRNEDAWLTSFASQILNASAADQLSTADTGHNACATAGWAVVADGMGGHPAGDVASRTVVEFVANRGSTLTDREAIETCMSVADHVLEAASSRDPLLCGMGSTVAGVVVQDTTALAFNLGDSRVYHWSNGLLRRLSVDHTDRIGALTRYLGGGVKTKNPLRLMPNIVEAQLSVGDHLLICTDGLTKGLSDGEIQSLLHSEQPADELLEAALRKDGSDNITFVLLEFYSDQRS